jgi:hypothetical protein
VIVVHALWQGGRLTLWGEDTTPEHTTGGAAEHPFAATPEDLAAVLGGPAREGLAAVTTLSLPTRGRRPLDSPELVRDEEPKADRGAVTLAKWRVPTLALDPDEAIEVLAGLSDDEHVSGA